MKTIGCNCQAWNDSANQIFTAQVQFTLSTGIKYTGSQFVYCPFCGRHLTPLALDGGDSAARQAESTPEVDSIGGADSTPPPAGKAYR